jgi:Putative Ig domain
LVTISYGYGRGGKNCSPNLNRSKMKPRPNSKPFLFLIVAIAVFGAIGCGVGNSGPSEGGTPPPPSSGGGSNPPPTLTFPTVPLGNGNVGLPYESVAYAYGGSGGVYSWSIVPGSGSLPPGVTLTGNDGEGQFTGTPTSPGTFNFTAKVVDPGPPSQTATQALSIVIDNRLVITTDTLPIGILAKMYDSSIPTAGGTPPYAWSLNPSSTLPPGLQLNPLTGLITGSPTQAGNFSFFAHVTDSTTPQSLGFDKVMYLTVNPDLSFTSTLLPDAVVSRNYSYSVPIRGGVPPYAIQITSGSLPAGITVPGSSSNVPTFAGSPSAQGTSAFTLQVMDSQSPPVTIQQPFSLRTNPMLVGPSLTGLPNGIVGLPYAVSLQASGGLPPLNWSITSSVGGLAAGIFMDAATGILSGTPTAAFSGSECFTVSDSSSPSQSWEDCAALSIFGKVRVATSFLSTVAENVPVSVQLGASGGIGHYTWSQVSGTAPQGITFDPVSGTFTGQTNQTGTFPITVQVADSGPPAQTSDAVTLQFMVGVNLGRNDSPANATPLSNGTYLTSISPFSDPPTGVGNPDSDYYRLTANPGAVVRVEIRAQRLTPPSPLDSVLEIVDANKNRLSLCGQDPNATPVFSYAFACLNDDLAPGLTGTTDSALDFQVPVGASGPLTFYAHVLDFRGNARPDFIYTITVSGVN